GLGRRAGQVRDQPARGMAEMADGLRGVKEPFERPQERGEFGAGPGPWSRESLPRAGGNCTYKTGSVSYAVKLRWSMCMATLFQRTATADSIPPVPGLRYRRRERHLLEPRSLPVLCDTARHN